MGSRNQNHEARGHRFNSSSYGTGGIRSWPAPNHTLSYYVDDYTLSLCVTIHGCLATFLSHPYHSPALGQSGIIPCRFVTYTWLVLDFPPFTKLPFVCDYRPPPCHCW